MSIIKQTSPPKERHILLREKQSWKDKSPITPTIWERAVETSTGIPCSLLRDLPDLWFRSLQLCFFSSSDHANSDLLLGPSMNGVFNNRSLTSSKAPRHRQTGKPRSTRSTQWHRDLQSSSSGQTRSCPSGSRSKSSNPQTRTKRLHSRIGGAGWSRLEECRVRSWDLDCWKAFKQFQAQLLIIPYQHLLVTPSCPQLGS